MKNLKTVEGLCRVIENTCGLQTSSVTEHMDIENNLGLDELDFDELKGVLAEETGLDCSHLFDSMTRGKRTVTDIFTELKIRHKKEQRSELDLEESETPCNVSHYNITYRVPITEEDLEKGYKGIKVDPYFVSSVWKVGKKDPSGCLFHILKTISRFGEKEGNTAERELDSILKTTQRRIELED